MKIVDKNNNIFFVSDSNIAFSKDCLLKIAKKVNSLSKIILGISFAFFGYFIFSVSLTIPFTFSFIQVMKSTSTLRTAIFLFFGCGCLTYLFKRSIGNMGLNISRFGWNLVRG